MNTTAIPSPEAGELIVVVGPTASGKTALAIEIAERFSGEIVGADSVQIYRRFDVGSGKPSVSDLGRVRHHLVDVIDPLSPISAGGYVALADAAIADIRSRGRVPVVCGGTFLWVLALLHGLAEGAPSSDEIRAQHRAFVEEHGRPALHARLVVVDPPIAAKLAPNDFVRVSRALEVLELTGERMSVVQARHAFREERHRHRLIGRQRTQEELRTRVEQRTAQWLADGWIDEVRALVAAGYADSRPIGSVGYKQVHAHVRGELAADQLKLAITRATMVFSRRQRTWLRDRAVTWL